MSHNFQSQNISRTITNILLATFEITSTDLTGKAQSIIHIASERRNSDVLLHLKLTL